ARVKPFSSCRRSPQQQLESFADRLLQSNSKTASLFIDLRWIPSTSNDVERLFSTARLVLTDRRQRMHPTTLETLI
ncbi:hypothetical protein JG688_00016653, partial [Phytophthora aleatoria]